MANMFQMMKQANQLRKMQKQLASKTVEVSSPDGNVTVVVRADMSVKSIRIKPEWVDPTRVERLEKVLLSTVNSAMDAAKKAAAADMQKLTGGLGGLSDLLGGG